ncbi:MAG: hypothetical protein WCE32_06710, partial [Pseudolabrys sp.]
LRKGQDHRLRSLEVDYQFAFVTWRPLHHSAVYELGEPFIRRVFDLWRSSTSSAAALSEDFGGTIGSIFGIFDG